MDLSRFANGFTLASISTIAFKVQISFSETACYGEVPNVVAFVDVDGGMVEYSVNSTSGKLDCIGTAYIVYGLTTCKRIGATIIDDGGKTTAPDEETAQRVIELFDSCCKALQPMAPKSLDKQ